MKNLEINPYKPRVNCYIKILKNTDPAKNRLRIGNHRVIYLLKGKNVKVIDLIKRESGYSRLD